MGHIVALFNIILRLSSLLITPLTNIMTRHRPLLRDVQEGPLVGTYRVLEGKDGGKPICKADSLWGIKGHLAERSAPSCLNVRPFSPLWPAALQRRGSAGSRPSAAQRRDQRTGTSSTETWGGASAADRAAALTDTFINFHLMSCRNRLL